MLDGRAAELFADAGKIVFAHFALVEFGRGLAVQVGVIVGGIALMAALAYLMHWFRQRGAAARPAATEGR